MPLSIENNNNICDAKKNSITTKYPNSLKKNICIYHINYKYPVCHT